MATVKVTDLGQELGLTRAQMLSVLARRGAGPDITHLTTEGADRVRQAIVALHDLAEMSIDSDLPDNRWWDTVLQRAPGLAESDRAVLLDLAAEIGLPVPRHAPAAHRGAPVQLELEPDPPAPDITPDPPAPGVTPEPEAEAGTEAPSSPPATPNDTPTWQDWGVVTMTPFDEDAHGRDVQEEDVEVVDPAASSDEVASSDEADEELRERPSSTDFAFARPPGWPHDRQGPLDGSEDSVEVVEESSDDHVETGELVRTRDDDPTSIVVARPEHSRVDVLDFFSPSRHTPSGRTPAGAPGAGSGMSAAQASFTEVTAALRRNRWWVAAATLACFALAIVLSLRTPPVYSSDAALLLRPVPDASGRADTVEPSMATEQELIKSEAMAIKVAEFLDAQAPPSSIARGLSVDLPDDTSILELEYRSSRPDVAQERLQAYIDVYLETRLADITADRDAASTQIRNEIANIDQAIAELEEDLAADPNDDSIESQIDVLKAQRVQRQLALAEIPTTVNVATILKQPSLPNSPSGPDHTRDAILGLMGGLVLGISVALLRDRLDDDVHTTRQLQSETEAPVLATIPRASRRDRDQRLLRSEEDGTAAGEAYRSLAINVSSELRNRAARTLVVASAERGEGATDVVLNLASLLGRTGKDVVVVCASLRDTTLARSLDVDGVLGLTDVLDSRARLRDVVQRTSLPRVRALGIGTTLVAELLASDRLEHVLDDLSGLSDIVLIDTGPILDSAEFLAVTRAAQHVLLVSSQVGLARRVLQAATQRIRQIGGELVGTVVNDVSGPRIARDFAV